MKTRIAPLLAVAFIAACASPDSGPTAARAPEGLSAFGAQLATADMGPADAHIFLAKGVTRNGNDVSPFARTVNMTYHGGKIMTTANIKAIYWGTSWGSPGDKITGNADLYNGWSGSHFAKTNIEFTGSNGTVGSTASYGGSVVDLTAASGGGSTAAILAAVCRNIPSPDATGNGYYPVYTDIPRGSAGYCAWHSAGTCGGKAVQFAFFWKLDGDSGCDPGDTRTVHSQGMEALANVVAHELSEAVTDPASPGAWYDRQGYENADKCAWAFNDGNNNLVTLANGTVWKLQGNWSNKAYTAGTGYANSSGQKGCISSAL